MDKMNVAAPFQTRTKEKVQSPPPPPTATIHLHASLPEALALQGVTANARLKGLMGGRIKRKQKQKSHHKLQIKGSAKPLLL